MNKSVFSSFAVSRPNALDGSKRFLIRNSSFVIRNSLVPRTGVSFVIRHWSEATLDRQTDRQTDLSPSEENFCISHLSNISEILFVNHKFANLTTCQPTAEFLLP